MSDLIPVTSVPGTSAGFGYKKSKTGLPVTYGGVSGYTTTQIDVSGIRMTGPIPATSIVTPESHYHGELEMTYAAATGANFPNDAGDVEFGRASRPASWLQPTDGKMTYLSGSGIQYHSY